MLEQLCVQVSEGQLSGLSSMRHTGSDGKELELAKVRDKGRKVAGHRASPGDSEAHRRPVIPGQAPPPRSRRTNSFVVENHSHKAYLSSCELVASMLRMLLSARGHPDRLQDRPGEAGECTAGQRRLPNKDNMKGKIKKLNGAMGQVLYIEFLGLIHSVYVQRSS